jgi:predicted acetyltransferase
MNTQISHPFLLRLIPLYLSTRRSWLTYLNCMHTILVSFSLDLGPDGRFGYESLPLYWSEPNRHPFLIRGDGKLAGLALVKRGSEISGNQTVWDMSEFFVLRGCRRRGIGMLAAQEVWRRFPGIWEVRVMQSNVLANLFWEQAISTFNGEAIQPVRVEKGGRYWQLFSFESKPGISKRRFTNRGASEA